MYCISLAIVVSWIHILIKHSQFLLTRSRMRRLWTREMANHCLLNSLVLETPSAKCERRSPRFYLLVLSRYKKLKLNGKHVSLIWKRSADRDVKQHFFFFFFACAFISTRVLNWDIDITRLQTYSTVSAFTETPALSLGSIWFWGSVDTHLFGLCT